MLFELLLSATFLALAVGFISYQLWTAFSRRRLIGFGIASWSVVARDEEPKWFWFYVAVYVVFLGIVIPPLAFELPDFVERVRFFALSG